MRLIMILSPDSGLMVDPPDDSGRVARHHDIGWDVLEDDGVDPYHRVAADAHAGHDSGLTSDPDVVFDDHWRANARVPSPVRGLGVRLVIIDKARAKHAVCTNLDSLSRDERAAIQPGIPPD